MRATPVPRRREPKTVQMSRSSVRVVTPGIFRKRSRKAGYRMVDRMVLAAKVLPRLAVPMRNSRKLMRNTVMDRERNGKKWVSARLIPVEPPMMIPDGEMKAATAKATSALPRSRQAAWKSCCLVMDFMVVWYLLKECVFMIEHAETAEMFFQTCSDVLQAIIKRNTHNVNFKMTLCVFQKNIMRNICSHSDNVIRVSRIHLIWLAVEANMWKGHAL